MTQTAADRRSSFSHNEGERYSTQRYDDWSNWLYKEYKSLERKPTLDEFMAYLGRRGENVPRSTARTLMKRRWATGTCRPQNWKNSMGVSPQNIYGGTTEKLRFERDMAKAKEKQRKKRS